MNKEIKTLNKIYSSLPEGEKNLGGMWERAERPQRRPFRTNIWRVGGVIVAFLVVGVGVLVQSQSAKEGELLYEVKQKADAVVEKMRKALPVFPAASPYESLPTPAEPPTQEVGATPEVNEGEDESKNNNGEVKSLEARENNPTENDDVRGVSDEARDHNISENPGLERREETPAASTEISGNAPSDNGNKGNNPGNEQAEEAKDKGKGKLKNQ